MELIENFDLTGELDKEAIILTLRNNEIRKALFEFISECPNRSFAIAFAKKVIELRAMDAWADDYNDYYTIYLNDLLYTAYLVSLHGQVQDAALIWQIKSVDFDAYCGFDIQMVVFAGIEKTLHYLQSEGTAEALQAIEYIKECETSGDFRQLESYFSKDKLPMYILESD